VSRQYRPGDTVHFSFPITLSTGALGNADALPTAKVIRDGAIDAAVIVTINAALQAGVYSGSYAVPGGYAAGDTVDVFVFATVGGITTGNRVDSIRLVALAADEYATATALAAVDTEVGTLVTQLGTPAGASVSADIAAVKAVLPDVAVVSEVDGSATTTGFAAAAGLSSTNDFYAGSVVAMTSGALKGLARRVTSYTGVSRTFTFAAALPAAPSVGDDFVILGRIDADA
jgi:hypothetical protein